MAFYMHNARDISDERCGATGSFLRLGGASASGVTGSPRLVQMLMGEIPLHETLGSSKVQRRFI